MFSCALLNMMRTCLELLFFSPRYYPVQLSHSPITLGFSIKNSKTDTLSNYFHLESGIISENLEL